MIYPNWLFFGLWIAAPALAFNAREEVVGDGVAANTDGTGTAAQVNTPGGIEAFNDGYLFTTLHMLRFLDWSSKEVTTLAGQNAYGSDDGDGTNALFYTPYGLSVHPSGTYCLVADHRNYLIRRVTLSSPYTVTTVAGDTSAFINLDGAGTNANFNFPIDVKIAPNGNTAFVLEYYIPRIRVMDLTVNPHVVTTLAGSFQGTSDGTGTNAAFWNPNSIAIVPDGSALYVADVFTKRVRHVTYPGGVVTTFCGQHSAPQVVDGHCDSDARFSYPLSVEVSSDGSTLYVAERQSIRSIDISTRVISTMAGITPAVESAYDIAFASDYSYAVITAYLNHRIDYVFTQISPPPTTYPTSQPTEAEAQHMYVHAVDVHGDGWGNDLYLAVQHYGSSEPRYYSLNCACKVVRLFSESGNMTISMYRNTTEPGPRGQHVPYEWEALFAVGYSDGVTAEPVAVFGGVDTEVQIYDWTVISSARALDIKTNAPKNKCVPPAPPKPHPSSGSTTDTSSVSSTGNATDSDSTEDGGPSPLVNVRLTLQERFGDAWCDDSGEYHQLSCSKEHHLSVDATLPNILTYPRYFISDAEGRVLMQQGTMRVAVEEDVREVKLPREGAFVFSVSGHDTSSVPDRRFLSGSSTISWDFCGEQGGLNERLHFNMVHGVCKPHYIEQVGELSCDGEWSTDTALLTQPTMPLRDSAGITRLRFGLQIETLVASLIGVIALIVLVAVKIRRRPVVKKIEFSALDSTEHVL